MELHPSTRLARLESLFPNDAVYGKCEFLAPSGCFKIRGANHLLAHLLKQSGTRHLVVPSMGNTALGAAVAAQAHGFTMTGVVPRNISQAKDEKLRALGVELVKIDGGGTDLLRAATDIAAASGGYFVHPHLDRHWTDGYKAIAAEILEALPDCRTIVFPVGGGGLLLGLLAQVNEAASVALVGCEPYTYPKYARFGHSRTSTIADGLRIESPHPAVQQAIAAAQLPIELVSEEDIRKAVRAIFELEAMVIEPSSAVPVAWAMAHAAELRGPVCIVLTGGNVAPEDHCAIMAAAAVA